MSTVDLTQWKDRTEAPVIVWAYVGTWDLQPVAVDDTHDTDTYNELTRAQIEELYSRGDGSAEAAGLPAEFVATGVNDDGSDALIYVDEATVYNTHRETLAEATPHLDPESVAEIYREILAAREDYAR